ncbi:MAG: hypothetical protein HY063_03190 [Bacteroidetes bacterium]|nr:hypothetical protein [Bacteroidota bacterium]
MNNSNFPTTLEELNSYFELVVPYLSANAARLVIDAANITNLNTLFDATTPTPNTPVNWQDTWTLYNNKKVTRTTAVKDLIRDPETGLEKKMKDQLMLIYNDIPKTKWNAADRETLHRKTGAHDANPTPTHAPEKAPGLSVDKNEHLVTTLRFTNPDTPHSHAKPEGVISVEVYEFIVQNPVPPPPPAPGGGAGQPPLQAAAPPLSSFTHIGSTGHFLFRATHADTDEGKKVFYYVKYKTQRGQMSPPSEVKSAIII